MERSRVRCGTQGGVRCRVWRRCSMCHAVTSTAVRARQCTAKQQAATGSNHMHTHMRKAATGHERAAAALTDAADSSGDSANSDAYGASTLADAARPPSFMMAHGAIRCPNSTYNNTINRMSDLYGTARLHTAPAIAAAARDAAGTRTAGCACRARYLFYIILF